MKPTALESVRARLRKMAVNYMDNDSKVIDPAKADAKADAIWDCVSVINAKLRWQADEAKARAHD